ncbi:hypothetical protein Adt_27695 [Abeliophyllum distichum]|uniref:Uncharacterized protein n=1 Tax=Abeliophyllum distichum TaxID=126358 RepID=A0ABD1RWJ8_9LAMI
MANLINSCGWERVADHRYITWVRGKWIKFNPAVIEDYYGLTANDIEHIPADLDMTQVTQFLYGRADARPLVGPKFLHNKLTESLRIFHIFVCHNIDPTSHLSDFNESQAQFLYHLASEGVQLLPHKESETPELPINKQTLGNPMARRTADNPAPIPAAETDRLLRQIFTQLFKHDRVLSSIQHIQLAMQQTDDHMCIEMNSLKESNIALRGE